MADDLDVPPLEDMSEMLHQLGVIQENKFSNTAQETLNISTNSTLNPKSPGVGQYGESVCAPQTGSSSIPTPKQTKLLSKQPSKENKPKTFGGMKKGFLFGPSQSCAKTVVTDGKDVADDVPFIKPKNSDNKTDAYKFPEVQEAMKASQAFTKNTEWVTEDLLKQVQDNENVMHKLADPRFMQAVTEFQTNPQAAMAKYQSNEEIQSFLKSFCGILGNHFSSLAGQQAGQSGQSGPASSVATLPEHKADIQECRKSQSKSSGHEDEQHIQEILANPEMREILMDPRIQRLIETLRNNPEKAQSVVRSADGDLRMKIHQLIDAGLLQIQR